MFRLRSIDYIRGKIKAWARFMDRQDIYAISIVIVVGFISFFLGQLSRIDRERPSVAIQEYIFGDPTPLVTAPAVMSVKTTPNQGERQVASPAAASGLYVGSKTSDKYHLPHCAGALRIAESNKVWFATKAEAETAGYSPAANCKGI